MNGRFEKRWRIPVVKIVRAADPVTRLVRNRYGTTMQLRPVTIGLALYVRGRGLSLLWARPHWVRS